MPTSEQSGGSPVGRRSLRGLVSLVVVVGVFVGVLPRVADLSEVWDAVRAMTATEVVSLVVLTMWNLVSYWLVQVSVLPGLGLWQAGMASQSATALANSLPAGAAVGLGVNYAMYASWGFPRSTITRSLLLSGLWNNFVKVGMPVVALALLAVQGDANVALLAAALVGLGMLVLALMTFGLMLRSERLAKRVGTVSATAVSRLRRLVSRDPVSGWADAAARFRADTVGLLRDRWGALTLTTLVSHVTLYLLLLVALRHVGVSNDDVGWAEVLGAFAFVRLISALPITPGGLGVVELGLVAALVVAGGEREPVVAGVLVYRVLTYLVPIPIGLVTYLAWTRRSTPTPPRAAMESSL
ncbi:MAG: YbhN family protein [Actinomycetota bacterium]|nr:YbhN family protein [Actinomycetota bacterium]